MAADPAYSGSESDDLDSLAAITALGGLDPAVADTMDLLARFSDLAISGELKSALHVLQAIIRAKRHDVLSRYTP